MVRLDNVELEMTTLKREGVGVAPIVEKLVETRLRWFDHVEKILIEFIVS